MSTVTKYYCDFCGKEMGKEDLPDPEMLNHWSIPVPMGSQYVTWLSIYQCCYQCSCMLAEWIKEKFNKYVGVL